MQPRLRILAQSKTKAFKVPASSWLVHLELRPAERGGSSILHFPNRSGSVGIPLIAFLESGHEP